MSSVFLRSQRKDERRLLVDRSLARAIGISLLIHAMLVAIVASGSFLKGPLATRVVAGHEGAAFDVALLPPREGRPDDATPPDRTMPDAGAEKAPSTAEPVSSLPSRVADTPATPAAPAASGAPGATSDRQPAVGSAASAIAAATSDVIQASDYRRALLLHIRGYRHAPNLEERRWLLRPTMVRFGLERDGRVQWVDLISSSGAAGVDEEAMATVWRAQPMPAIPATLPDRLEVTLPVALSEVVAARVAN
ncbi:MAG: energy transducer TonB [Pseudomonadota bacterium]|jgi:protein TonB